MKRIHILFFILLFFLLIAKQSAAENKNDNPAKIDNTSITEFSPTIIIATNNKNELETINIKEKITTENIKNNEINNTKQDNKKGVFSKLYEYASTPMRYLLKGAIIPVQSTILVVGVGIVLYKNRSNIKQNKNDIEQLRKIVNMLNIAVLKRTIDDKN